MGAHGDHSPPWTGNGVFQSLLRFVGDNNLSLFSDEFWLGGGNVWSPNSTGAGGQSFVAIRPIL